MILKTKPIVMVFAGPNGSGKSTVTNAFEKVGMYINADDIKARSEGAASDLAAAQEAESLREHCICNKKDFTFETVLSTDRNLNLLKKAKKAGFYLKGVFVLTINPKINVARVKSRVMRGGHDVPPEKIRSRYCKSLNNLSELVKICDEIQVYDNSRETAAVIFLKNQECEAISETQDWTYDKIHKLVYG